MINLLHLQIFAILALLSISCAYALFQTRNTSLNQNIAYKIRLNKFDFLNILLIIVISFCISIPHLGERAKKASYYSLQSNDQLELNFAKPTTLKQINLYIGNLDGDFKVYVANKNIQQIELLEVKTDSTHPLNYRWLSYGVNSQLQFNKLWIRTTIAPIEIKQIALFDNSNRYITDVAITSNQTIKPQNLLITKHVPLKIINTPQNTMIFDEVYYAKTALDYLHKIAPTLSENPHLSTFIIAAGIAMFGETPFGWRIMPLLCGILVLIIVYLFALQLFRQRKIALVAAFLLMFDFMHFSINRYALIEPEVTLFICLEYYFLYQYILANNALDFKCATRNILYVGICLGLGLACKWTALFTLIPIGIVILLCVIRKAKLLNLPILFTYALSTMLIPSLIYILSFVPYSIITQQASLFELFINAQKLMLWFHSKGIKELHSMLQGSQWWSWPLIMNPMNIYSLTPVPHQVISITLMGNPLIWWLGIPAIILIAIYAIKQRQTNYLFIALLVAAQLLPFIFISRISYIYYFYSVTPLWILSIAASIQVLLKSSTKKLNILIYIYLAAVIGLFIMFYPVLAGVEIDSNYILKYLSWYPSWHLYQS
jgi:predicted membrane-bound dolichyl-phosphate-mannose-protein mannosyltransferase